jgi:branched-chain amino acid transport system substrate-binding protein
MRGLMLGIGLGLVSLIVSIGCAPKAEPTPTPTPMPAEELLIGGVNPMSGPAASYGIAVKSGFELGADKLNSEGGIKAGGKIYKIKAIWEDDKYSADLAVTAVNKLFYQDKVKIIVGPLGSAGAVATQKFINENKIIQFAAGAYAMPLGPEYPYSFRATVPGPLQGPTFMTLVRKEHPEWKTYASIFPNDASGWGIQKGMAAAAEAQGFKLVRNEFYERGTKDFYPVLTKIIAANPDFITGDCPSGDTGLIVKQAYELGYKGQIYSTASLSITEVVDIAGKEASEGFANFNAIYYQEFEGIQASPSETMFTDMYTKRYGLPVMSGPGLSAMPYMFKQAIETVDSVDTTEIARAMENMTFNTPFGTFDFGGLKTWGIKHELQHDMYLLKVKNGQIRTVARIHMIVP